MIQVYIKSKKGEQLHWKPTKASGKKGNDAKEPDKKEGELRGEV